MGRKITLTIEVEVPEDVYDKAIEYVVDDNIYDLLDLAEDYSIIYSEYEED